MQRLVCVGGRKKAWPSAMEEIPCFLLHSSKLSSPVSLTLKCVWVCVLWEGTVGYMLVCMTLCYPSRHLRVCVHARVCLSSSCAGVESDQTVSQLPWEGSSGCDRVEEAKYPGSNTLPSLSPNETASPGFDCTHRILRPEAGMRRQAESLTTASAGSAHKGSFHL